MLVQGPLRQWAHNCCKETSRRTCAHVQLQFLSEGPVFVLLCTTYYNFTIESLQISAEPYSRSSPQQNLNQSCRQQNKNSGSLLQTPQKLFSLTLISPHPQSQLLSWSPPTTTTTQTCPPARFIMPFHADQNCSCMENNLEHISSGAVIYKLFLRP